MVAQGYLSVQESVGAKIVLAKGGAPDARKAGRLAAQLKLILEETAAFREYFHRAEAQSLIDSGANAVQYERETE
jgi:hypothetical protein